MVRALEGDVWRQLMGLDKEERKACGKVDVKGKSVAKEEDGVESATNVGCLASLMNAADVSVDLTSETGES